jgi:flagellar hook assembly protein FlgD
MLGNAPNPFNPETVIRFRLPAHLASQTVRLTVLNTRGQKVSVLADGVLGSGEHRITWRGTDDAGRPVASGIYLYRLEVGGEVITRKMLLLR